MKQVNFMILASGNANNHSANNDLITNEMKRVFPSIYYTSVQV